jgi:hypothetical protein
MLAHAESPSGILPPEDRLRRLRLLGKGRNYRRLEIAPAPFSSLKHPNTLVLYA